MSSGQFTGSSEAEERGQGESPVLRIICNEDLRAREACGKERESDI